MKCDKNYDIVAYLKGELSSVERDDIRVHIESCPSCMREANKVDLLLGAVGKMKMVEPSDDMRWKVKDAFAKSHPEFMERYRVRSGDAGWWKRFRNDVVEQIRFMPIWAIAASAHVVVIAILSIIFAGSAPNEEKRTVGVKPPRDQALATYAPRKDDKPPIGSVRPDTNKKEITPEEHQNDIRQTVSLLSDPDPEVRKSALIILAKRGGAEVVPSIEKMKDDPDESVRKTAADILSKLPPR